MQPLSYKPLSFTAWEFKGSVMTLAFSLRLRRTPLLGRGTMWEEANGARRGARQGWWQVWPAQSCLKALLVVGRSWTSLVLNGGACRQILKRCERKFVAAASVSRCPRVSLSLLLGLSWRCAALLV